MDLANGSI